MPSDDESKNPFVRFKQHVESRISSGLQGVLGLPSLVTQNLNSRPLRSEEPHVESQRYRYDRHSDPPAASSSPDPDRRIYEQRQGTSREAWSDRDFDGYGPLEHMRRWQIFAYGSRYSPLLLATLPDQPCPRDLPEWMDPGMFTYLDAFEDLLAQSEGRPMMDLQTRYEMNIYLAGMWPRGEHPLAWYSRLESQNLSEAFSRYLRGNQYTPARVDDPAELLTEDDQEKLGHEAAQEANIERAETPSRPSPRHEELGVQTGLFGELDKAFKELGKVLEDEISSFGQRRRPREDRPKTDSDGEAPKTEADLYDTVRSAYYDAERSLSTFVKSFTDGKWRFEPWGDDAKAGGTNAPSEEVREDKSGKTVTSTNEYVDAFGNLHSKTEVRRTDWDGNVVATETHYFVRPAPQTRKVEQEPQEERPREEPPEKARRGQDEKQDGKDGWFWK